MPNTTINARDFLDYLLSKVSGDNGLRFCKVVKKELNSYINMMEFNNAEE